MCLFTAFERIQYDPNLQCFVDCYAVMPDISEFASVFAHLRFYNLALIITSDLQ